MTNPKVWLITDTHFGHKKLVEWGERPAGFENLIVNNWTRLVGNDDVVIHLGDVWFGKGSELGPFIEKLPGIKILVRGNHDQERTQWYMRRGFTLVVNDMTHRHVLLTHEPQFLLPGTGVELNVHGHLHGNSHRIECEWYRGSKKHKELALEWTNYSPVLFEEFVKQTPPLLSPIGEGSPKMA